MHLLLGGSGGLRNNGKENGNYYKRIISGLGFTGT